MFSKIRFLHKLFQSLNCPLISFIAVIYIISSMVWLNYTPLGILLLYYIETSAWKTPRIICDIVNKNFYRNRRCARGVWQKKCNISLQSERNQRFKKNKSGPKKNANFVVKTLWKITVENYRWTEIVGIGTYIIYFINTVSTLCIRSI